MDHAPRVAGLGGVEVVRRLASPTSEVLMTASKPKPRLPKKPAKNSTRKSKPNAVRVSSANNSKTKHDRVLGMLRVEAGATIAAIVRATGWRPHSVRGFLAGVVKKKLGLILVSEKTGSGRIYRIVDA